MNANKVVNLIVGEVYYSLHVSDIERFPECYFSHLLKDEWNRDRSTVIQIDRDGNLFRYVSNYISTGIFERCSQQSSLEHYIAIRREADFYNLPSMVELCDEKIFQRMQYYENYNGSFSDLCTSAPYPLQLYDCEADFGSPSQLLHALNASARPPIIATTTLALTLPLPVFFPTERSRVREASFHNCYKVTSAFSGQMSLDLVCAQIQLWPLFAEHAEPLNITRPQAYLYPTGSYATSHTYMFDNHLPRVGTILYIPVTCVYTGGKVTSRACGQTMSIENPGECMSIGVGAQFSVDRVTSGQLVLVEMFLLASDHETDEETQTHGKEECGEVIMHTWSAPAATVDMADFAEDNMRTAVLKSVLDAELTIYTGVVICLTHYYPVTHSPDPENNHLYTDPDVLKQLDRALYEMLVRQDYTVSVVAVYINRSQPDRAITPSGTNLATATQPTSSSYDNTSSGCSVWGCIVDSTNLPNVVGAKYKVVPVVYGYGKTFPSRDGKELGTLVTGLLVTRKLAEARDY
eukprot:gene19558-22235_t